MPTSRARPSACPGCRSGQKLPWEHIGYPARARRATTASSRRRSWFPSTDSPGGRGPAGRAQLRDPADGQRDSRFDHLRAGTSCAAALPPRTATTSGPWACSCSRGGSRLPAHRPRPGRHRSLRCVRNAVTAAFFALSVVVTIVYFVLVERALLAFRPLRPDTARSTTRTSGGTNASGNSLNSVPPRLQRHPVQDRDLAAAGCADRPEGLRRRRPVAREELAAIGDDCTLNAGTEIQCHSQEDGAFKSDRITIGAGCTLGVGALVHYGVTMGDGSVLAPGSFR